MTLFKNVNGVDVEMSAEEEAAIRAEWAANAGAVIVPVVVTPYQARSALLAAGLLTAVDEAVAAGSDQAKIAWEYAIEIRRDSPFIAEMAAALSLNDQALDDLFIVAGAIQ